MQADNSQTVKPSINVTPLVDVVLVLLIIFMVVTPMLGEDDVVLPATEDPPELSEDRPRLEVTIDQFGAIALDQKEVQRAMLVQVLLEKSDRTGVREVVINADGRLPFGEVRTTMLAVRSAGFSNVGLLTRKRGES
jgi:biopolymer transport protein TolR